MSFLMNLPVVLKIFISLTIILGGNRLVKNLGLSVLLGILALAFLSGHSPASAGRIAWTRLSEISQIYLYIVIFLIIWLSSQMKETGTMEDLVRAVQSRISRRASMAVLPALIGLLPMPGGAIFSAPLVDSCDENGGVEPVRKSRINYWFRHMWEYWWPLYPGVLLAIDLSGLGVGKFALLMAPVTLLFLAGGWIFLLRKIPGEKRTGTGAPLKELLLPLLPIIITMGIYILLLNLFPALSRQSKYVPMIFGILTALAVQQIRKPLAASKWRKIILNPKTLSMVVLVALIRVYGAFIEAPLPDGVFLMERMRDELASWGIPVLLFVIIIPFLSGLATGIAIGTVGASFPIVMSLLGAHPDRALLLSTVMLAYSFGHAGMMLSPVHVCLIVSSKYYETGILGNLKGLMGPVLFLMVSAFLLSRLVGLIF